MRCSLVHVGLAIVALGILSAVVDLWVWAIHPLSQPVTLAWGLTSFGVMAIGAVVCIAGVDV